ncbi:MAG: hypothetical protein QOI04_1648 [Verrucomicrobiota bacterium]|jgi:hypothetical protein
MVPSLRALFFLSIVICAATLNAGALPRSVSTSRQFIVFGSDAALRGKICELGEETKKSLLTLLQQADDWKTPVVINAQRPQANLPEARPAELNFSQTGFGLKLQLDLTVASDADDAAIERELLRAVLIEIAYRGRQDLPAGTAYVQPSDWLLDGALAFAHDAAPLVETLAAIGGASKIISLQEFLRQRPEQLDSPSRSLYSAYAFALVQMLIDAPDGRAQLARYIVDLPRASNDMVADLEAHFPSLKGESGQKNWVLNVARTSAAERFRALSISETEQRLDDLLHINISDASRVTKTFALEDFSQWLQLPARTSALAKLNQALLILAGRANPIYRPIIAEYQKVESLLALGKSNGVAARLARLKTSRGEISSQTNAINDYMNWFEATQSKTRSGEFAEYLKAAARSLQAESRRHDRISVYLDVLETQSQK